MENSEVLCKCNKCKREIIVNNKSSLLNLLLKCSCGGKYEKVSK